MCCAEEAALNNPKKRGVFCVFSFAFWSALPVVAPHLFRDSRQSSCFGAQKTRSKTTRVLSAYQVMKRAVYLHTFPSLTLSGLEGRSWSTQSLAPGPSPAPKPCAENRNRFGEEQQRDEYIFLCCMKSTFVAFLCNTRAAAFLSLPVVIFTRNHRAHCPVPQFVRSDPTLTRWIPMVTG